MSDFFFHMVHYRMSTKRKQIPKKKPKTKRKQIPKKKTKKKPKIKTKRKTKSKTKLTKSKTKITSENFSQLQINKLFNDWKNDETSSLNFEEYFLKNNQPKKWERITLDTIDKYANETHTFMEMIQKDNGEYTSDVFEGKLNEIQQTIDGSVYELQDFDWGGVRNLEDLNYGSNSIWVSISSLGLRQLIFGI